MSKYTTELRFILETLAGKKESEGYNSVADIIETARPRLFDFDYPIFDEAYRPVLETKILRHYYTREICAETFGRWKLFLEAEMNEIMPYYNDLYRSAELEYDPLTDVDYKREGNKQGSSLNAGVAKMTGTVGDNGTTSNVRTSNSETTGSQTTSGRVQSDGEHDESISDDVTRTDNLHEATSNTRTDNLTETGSKTRTDNLTEETSTTRTDNLSETGSKTRTDNLRQSSADGGSQSVSRSNADKNDHWDLYSDTPQGGIAGLEGTMDDSSLGDNAYLTNARHITDDSTGSTSSEATTFGKTVQVDNTGTQQDSSTRTNTGTQDTDTTKTNTGTQQDASTLTNTGTQKNDGTKDNTGTQKTVSTRTITGTDSKTDVSSGSVSTTEETEGGENENGTSQNTRTYNTTNTNDVTVTDTGSYLERIYGKMPGKSYPKLVMEYRDALINVDMLIIKALSDLFMRLW